MNIAVYLGSNVGKNPVYKQAVIELGTWIGGNGHHLIYGGSESGLMGHLAKAALASGGTVPGVEPEFFIEQELQLDSITELIVTPDMHTRKAKMIELADVFITFPGGTGTLEEISEVISMLCLGHIDKSVAFYNVNHFYDAMQACFDHMTNEGFISQANRDKISFLSSIQEIANWIS